MARSLTAASRNLAQRRAGIWFERKIAKISSRAFRPRGGSSFSRAAMNLFSPPPSSLPLRDYQYKNVVEILDRIWRGERRIVDKLPTRAGKTRIAIELIKRLRIEGKRAIFVTPRISLIEQTCRAFEREGLDHFGVIQGKHWRTDSSAPVQIASVQILARREIPDSDLATSAICNSG
jgi:superfamily II DNA or RNA helicase